MMIVYPTDTLRVEISADVLQDWQEIVNILAEMLDLPAALIMRVVEPDIEVFLSSQTSDNPYHPGDREHLVGSGLYCETVIKKRDKLLVPDARVDPLWKNNPDIKLNMISYLGFPILLPDNEPFGTICVLDNKPNAYSELTEKLMDKFRGLLESHLELIFMNKVLGDKHKQLSDYLNEIKVLRGLVPICANCKSIRDEKGEWHSVEHYLIQHTGAELTHGLCRSCRKKLYPDYS